MTHWRISNLRRYIIKGFSIYFWAIHWDYFVFIWSWISTKLLYVVIPRPLDNPAGLRIQMLLCPVKWNWGNFFSYISRIYLTFKSSSSYYSSSFYSFYSTLFSFFSYSFLIFLVFFFAFFYLSSATVFVPLNLQSIDFSHYSCFFFARLSSFN